MLESVVHGPAGAFPPPYVPGRAFAPGQGRGRWVLIGIPALCRTFVVDRNIRHFLWYGGVASEGLRSDGVDYLPPSKSGCSILPLARHLRAGALRGSGPDRGIVRVQ